jgi:hypothetical protein
MGNGDGGIAIWVGDLVAVWFEIGAYMVGRIFGFCILVGSVVLGYLAIADRVFVGEVSTSAEVNDWILYFD